MSTTLPAVLTNNTEIHVIARANPGPHRGAWVEVHIDPTDEGLFDELYVGIELSEPGRTFTPLASDIVAHGTLELFFRACDLETVSLALSRAVAAAKYVGLIPPVPGIPLSPEEIREGREARRKEIEAELAALPPGYIAAHPGIEDFYAGKIPEDPPTPVASHLTSEDDERDDDERDDDERDDDEPEDDEPEDDEPDEPEEPTPTASADDDAADVKDADPTAVES